MIHFGMSYKAQTDSEAWGHEKLWIWVRLTLSLLTPGPSLCSMASEKQSLCLQEGTYKPKESKTKQGESTHSSPC